MKSKAIILLFAILIFSCNGSPDRDFAQSSAEMQNAKGTPEIEFKEIEHDFGRVIQGEKVGWYFSYKNTGDAPLIIRRASASCGCTVPEIDKEPLQPGEESKLKVVYNSSGRSGKDFKTVTVESNASNSPVKLKLSVEVITQ